MVSIMWQNDHSFCHMIILYSTSTKSMMKKYRRVSMAKVGMAVSHGNLNMPENYKFVVALISYMVETHKIDHLIQLPLIVWRH